MARAKTKVSDETAAESKNKRTVKAKAALATVAEETPKKTVTKVLTAEDFELNPSLTDEGYTVGDEVEVEDENDEEAADEALEENDIEEVDEDDVEVDIIKGDTEYIRTYSLADHGDDFMELAEQFCQKNPACKMVSPKGITSAVVFYREMDKKTKVSFNTSRLFQGANFKKQAIIFKNSVNGDYIAISKK